MSKPKYAEFLGNLVSVLENVGTENLKLTIGDSIDNNRVPTVNQVIRYLTRAGASRNQKGLGKQLIGAYGILRRDIQVSRAFSNSRTDAIDINELINVYDDLVLNGPTSFRRVVSRSLAA